MKVSYGFISILALFVTLLCRFNAVAADNGVISGKVISRGSKAPAIGVTVRVVGTNFGAVTKAEGRYEIKNLPPGIYSIQFSSVEFEKYIQSDVVVTNSKPVILETELVERVIKLTETEVRSSYFAKKIETATSTQSLGSEEIRRAPGVQEDVIRATALLPGVNVTQAGRNDLVVRGGAPFENLFVIDNIEVPNINHFGTQGTGGGPLAIVNIDFVRDVTFSAGAFGAAFGDKTSSITNIELRNGNEEKFGGKATLSATLFGLNIEGPLAGKGSSYWLSIRRSYLEPFFKAAGFSFIPIYWDLQSKVNYRLNDRNYLSFLFISALDNVELNNSTSDDKYDNSRVAIPDEKQYFSGITWKHLFESGYATVTLGESFSRYSTYQNDSNLVKVFGNESKEPETSLKIDFDLQISPKLQLQFGNRMKWATDLDYDVKIPGYYRVDQNGVPRELNIDSSYSAFKNGTYFSLTSIMGKMKFTLGGRMDYYGYIHDKLFFSPRMSVTYQITDLSSISASGGFYHQSPSYIWMIGDAGNKNMLPISADQAVLAYEHTPLEDVKVQFEVFYKWYHDYPARVFRPYSVLSPSGFDDLTSDIPYGLEPLLSSGKGVTRGIELFIQKKLSDIPLYGLFSLSIGQARFESIKGGERPGAYDSRVIANLSLGYRFNSEWELSGKFRYATGVPTTPFLPSGAPDNTRYNEGARLPDFHALDMRLDKRWNFSKYALVTYLDVQNIYARKNVSGIRWSYRTRSVEKLESIGVLPSIGVSFEF